MAYSPQQYATALHELSLMYPEKEQQERIFQTFLQHLSQTHQKSKINEILQHLSQLQKQWQQTNTVHITTPQKLTEQQKEGLQEMFSASNYTFTDDSRLISGVVVQAQNKVFNYTLHKTLEDLHSHFK